MFEDIEVRQEFTCKLGGGRTKIDFCFSKLGNGTFT